MPGSPTHASSARAATCSATFCSSCCAPRWRAREGFCDIAEWAQTKEGWLRTFLDLPGGIPSHDTFARVFRRLDPKELHACFLRWLESLVTREDQPIAIDGKTLRRSFDGSGTGRALHVVSAFAADGLGLVLGQVVVDDKSNEITAIPELLRLLDLKHAVVTIDAMGLPQSHRRADPFSRG